MDITITPTENSGISRRLQISVPVATVSEFEDKAALNEAFKEAVGREKLQLAAQPHVHDLKFEPGQPLEFELHCEVRPELKLEKLEGFTITRREAGVNEQLVEEQIEKLREQKGDWAPADDKPLPGDMVTAVLSTAEPDGTLPEGREYRLVLGSGQAIAAIEELIGHKIHAPAGM